jgi:hypothetical protein
MQTYLLNLLDFDLENLNPKDLGSIFKAWEDMRVQNFPLHPKC